MRKSKLKSRFDSTLAKQKKEHEQEKVKKQVIGKGMMQKATFGRLVLTKKGQKELEYAKLFLHEKGNQVLDSVLGEKKKPEWFSERDYFIKHEGRLPDDGIWALKKTQNNPRLGSSPIETLNYWFGHASAKQRKDFKRKHKNPEQELKAKKGGF